MRYSLENSPLGTTPAITMSRTSYGELQDHMPNLIPALQVAQASGTIRVLGTISVKLLFEFGQPFQSLDEKIQNEVWGCAYATFASIANFSTQIDDTDPNITLSIGTKPLSDGVRYGMEADIRRPSGTSNDLSAYATRHMQSVARQIQYPDIYEAALDDFVYASYRKEYGVTLETNPIGSCSLDTDGYRYNPFSQRIELYGHNLYDRKMQIICATGAIALAHYEASIK